MTVWLDRRRPVERALRRDEPDRAMAIQPDGQGIGIGVADLARRE